MAWLTSVKSFVDISLDSRWKNKQETDQNNEITVENIAQIYTYVLLIQM